MNIKKRELFEYIINLWSSNQNFVILGPRRAGKTTLLSMIEEKFGGKYISFEDWVNEEEFMKNPVAFIESFDDEIILLDEVQNLPPEKGGKAIKLICDSTKKRFLISGSGAFHIKLNLDKYLVGRAYFLELFPLSFKEFLEWKDSSAYKQFQEVHEKLYSAIKKGKTYSTEPSGILERYYKEYLKWGGYPQVVLVNTSLKEEEIKNIVRTTINEDIIRYFSIRATHRFRKLIEQLALKTGNLIDYSSFGFAIKTVEEYLSILENSYILERIRPYYTNKLLELRKKEKLYFYDNGFRNALLDNFRDIDNRLDGGVVVENHVFNQLRYKGLKIKYWRTKSKAEVDLILEKYDIPIEVKKGSATATRSLLSFIEKYSPKMSIVTGLSKVENHKNISIVQPYYF